MSHKQKTLREYLAGRLSGALVTEVHDAEHYRYAVFIPAELATHTITFQSHEFDACSIDELIALLEHNECFSLIETAAFSLDITFTQGVLLAQRRPAA